VRGAAVAEDRDEPPQQDVIDDRDAFGDRHRAPTVPDDLYRWPPRAGSAGKRRTFGRLY
jgi:hypothetical protein